MDELREYTPTARERIAAYIGQLLGDTRESHAMGRNITGALEMVTPLGLGTAGYDAGKAAAVGSPGQAAAFGGIMAIPALRAAAKEYAVAGPMQKAAIPLGMGGVYMGAAGLEGMTESTRMRETGQPRQLALSPFTLNPDAPPSFNAAGLIAPGLIAGGTGATMRMLGSRGRGLLEADAAEQAQKTAAGRRFGEGLLSEARNPKQGLLTDEFTAATKRYSNPPDEVQMARRWVVEDADPEWQRQVRTRAAEDRGRTAIQIRADATNRADPDLIKQQAFDMAVDERLSASLGKVGNVSKHPDEIMRIAKENGISVQDVLSSMERRGYVLDVFPKYTYQARDAAGRYKPLTKRGHGLLDELNARYGPPAEEGLMGGANPFTRKRDLPRD